MPDVGGPRRCAVLVVSRAPLVTAGIHAWIHAAPSTVAVAGVASTAWQIRTAWRDTRPDVVVLVGDTKVPSLLTVLNQEARDARILRADKSLRGA